MKLRMSPPFLLLPLPKYNHPQAVCWKLYEAKVKVSGPKTLQSSTNPSYAGSRKAPTGIPPPGTTVAGVCSSRNSSFNIVSTIKKFREDKDYPRHAFMSLKDETEPWKINLTKNWWFWCSTTLASFWVLKTTTFQQQQPGFQTLLGYFRGVRKCGCRWGTTLTVGCEKGDGTKSWEREHWPATVAGGQGYVQGTAAHLSGPASWSWPPEATCSTWNQPIAWAPSVLKRNPKNGFPLPPDTNPTILHDMKAAKFSYELRLRQRLHSPRHLPDTIGPSMLEVSNATLNSTFYPTNEHSILRRELYNCKLLSHLFYNISQQYSSIDLATFCNF